MIRRVLITIVMSFSFFGLFVQTNKFKTVDVAEFEKAVLDTSYVVLELGTGFQGWAAAGKEVETEKQ